ncbi:sensor histidine kinase [Geodermatophilus chilensis]|uniref:sensor histidine kinase n=1 Tax=Geodermatophilus chilensis TaxID=2035835 RepID=UPI0018E4CD90|nr:ATP-binding protein [Geodermatophilus chilensis]
MAGLLTTALVTVVVGGVLLAVDAGVGRLAGTTAAAVAAPAVAAATALPAYRWARRLTARLDDGSPPTGDRVLARLAALPRPASRGVPDLSDVVAAVGQGLGAGVCTLTVRRPGLRDRVATWSPAGSEPAEARWAVAVRHGGEDVGTLAVDRVTVPGTQAERRQVLEDVASSLGVVLRAERSGIELERQLRAALAHATEIAVARRRAVAESDSERRRIERDLHDGAQHQLVSLSLALGLVEHGLSTGRLDQARSGLDSIAAQLDTVADLLARTTAGVTSPVLARRGLVAALRQELAHDDPPVALDAPAGVRFPAEVEEAVYFVCLEAVNNSRKHAPGARVAVRLAADGARLHFAVVDDGPGFTPVDGNPGRGMHNVATRVASVGGRVDVRSAPGRGTTVEGSVPLPAPAPASAPAPGRAPTTAPPVGPGPLDRVRTLVRAARDLYHGSPQAEGLHALARALDGPLRIAVVGPPDPAVTALADGPAAGTPPYAVRRVDPEEQADAWVLVVDDTGTGDDQRPDGLPAGVRPSQAVGVLLGSGPDPGTARRCQAVTTLRPDEDLAARVRELIERHLLPRASALRTRSALAALEAALRAAPPRGETQPLRYQLDAIRSAAHELAELDLLDALVTGELWVPGDQRRAAEVLLGADGPEVWTRLGCGPAAGPDDLRRAAAEQLAHWQRVAAHPASPAASRRLAGALVQTCERLLAGASPR